MENVYFGLFSFAATLTLIWGIVFFCRVRERKNYRAPLSEDIGFPLFIAAVLGAWSGIIHWAWDHDVKPRIEPKPSAVSPADPGWEFLDKE